MKTFDEKITEIHNSEIYGSFIEMGCGCPITQMLCEVEGASKTIFVSANPYAKEAQRIMFDITERSVSEDSLRKILYSARTEFPETNYTLCSSFQLTPGNSHGYIGTTYGGIYHINLNSLDSRKEKIKRIGEIGIELIYNDVNINYNSFPEEIDYVVDDLNESSILISEESDLDKSFVSYPKKICRTEELLRKVKNGLILYKGSFNPITKAHLEIIDKTKEEYPDYDVCLSISTNPYDKNKVNSEDLFNRVRLINKLGYPVLVYNKPDFSKMVSFLRSKNYNNKLVFPMGIDTYNRIAHLPKNEWDVINDSELIVFDRESDTKAEIRQNVKYKNFSNSISSSKIRNDVRGNLDQIPYKIRKEVIKLYAKDEI